VRERRSGETVIAGLARSGYKTYKYYVRPATLLDSDEFRLLRWRHGFIYFPTAVGLWRPAAAGNDVENFNLFTRVLFIVADVRDSSGKRVLKYNMARVRWFSRQEKLLAHQLYISRWILWTRVSFLSELVTGRYSTILLSHFSTDFICRFLHFYYFFFFFLWFFSIYTYFVLLLLLYIHIYLYDGHLQFFVYFLCLVLLLLFFL